MYEPFFELKQRPFLSGPVASRYYPAAAIEQARQTLMSCIQRGAGAGLLVGPTGTGKTLLCNVLAHQFRGSHRPVLLAGAKLCTRKALFQSILSGLGLPYRDSSEGELRLALAGRLEPRVDPSAGLLLIVDEADTLPVRLLEELRMLTNIMCDGLPRVHLILAGAPTLEERLANPKFESFQQRIAARCHLRALTREETARYVAWQIELVGGRPEFVFDHTASGMIFEKTSGIPRLVNQVCDFALHAAALAGERPVMARHLAAAWVELQKAPSPWSVHATPIAPPPVVAAAAPSIIEFRALEDLPPLDTAALREFDFRGSPSLLEPVAAETATPAPEPAPSAAPQIVAVEAAPEPDHVEPTVAAPAAPVAAAPAPVLDEAWTQTTIVGPTALHAGDAHPSLCMAAPTSDWDAEALAKDEPPPIEDAPEHVVRRLHEELPLEAIPFDPAAETLGAGADESAVTHAGDAAAHELGVELAAPTDGESASEFAAEIDSEYDAELDAPEGAILRLVRDDEPAPAPEEPELPPPSERRRRFRELFTRLRRRASA